MRIGLVLLLLALEASLHAQPAGTFTVTGKMITARSEHTARLLADGRVLLTGGVVQGQVLASAELYDPSTGTFTATGNMTVPRALHTATLLADGRVLIADGRSAELYDPATGIFTATGTTTAPHGCSAVLLGGGKVLIAGDPAPFGSASADLYSPDTGTFSPTGTYASIEIAQLDHTLFPDYGGSDCPRATPLADGRVLIAGGAFAELYDPGTDTFRITGAKITLTSGFVKTLPQDWSDPSKATLLLNGMVLFNGGDADWGPAYSAWLYNPSVGTFTGTGSMSTPRVKETATLLPDGTVLVAGSFAVGGFPNLNPRALTNAELYDPSTGTFKAAPDLTTARFSHTATLLNDGRVLIAGGTTDSYPYKYLASAELYTPAVPIRAPVLFSLSGDGRGQGAIWHAVTGEIASPSNPAVAGTVLSMYTTSLADGGVIPPRVAIGGRLAEVLYFGAAPGYPGYNQVNFRVPRDVTPGSAAPVRLTYLGRPSNAVSIGVQ